MARIRSIKPGFFTSDDVADLSLRARLTWIGLWCYADDHGRAKDNVRLIKGAVWPLDDVTFAEIEADMAELHREGRIRRYEVDGKRYLEVANWSQHQRPNRPSPSQIPAFSEGSSTSVETVREPSVRTHGVDSEGSLNAHGIRGAKPDQNGHDGLTEGSLRAQCRRGVGVGGERGAALTEPSLSPRCPTHRDVQNPPPCPACADARRRYDATAKARPTTTGLPPTPDAPRCEIPGHEHEVASNCRICASEQLAKPDTPIESLNEGATS